MKKSLSVLSVALIATLSLALPTPANAAEVLPIPVVSSPAPLSLISAGADIEVAGTSADDGATVTVRLASGTELCSTVAEPDGSWSCAPLPPGTLATGHYQIRVQQEDAAGDTSPLGPLSSFSYGYDPVRIDSPADGERISNRPTVVGVANPSTRISVQWIGQPFGDQVFTDTASDGSFSVTFTTDVPPGPQEIRVNEFLSGGAGGSRTVSASVDVVVQAAIVPVDILSPADGSYVAPGFTLSGVGEPGARLGIREKGSPEVSRVDVAPDGTFQFSLNPAIERRTYTFEVIQDADSSTDEVTVTITTPVRISAPAEGSETAARPTITGNGTPGARVTLTDSGRALGSTGVSSDGTWAFQPTSDLAAGTHVLTADQDVDGTSASVSFSIAVFVTDPGSGTNPTGGALAATGADSSGLLRWAVLLVALGSVCVGLGRTGARRAVNIVQPTLGD